MQAMDLAFRYLAAFFGERSLDSLYDILDENLIFEGPFYQFKSAKDYISALYENPPTNSSYKLVANYENKNSACIIYLFQKPGVESLMAQQFEITSGKISHIRLVFDTAAFTRI